MQLKEIVTILQNQIKVGLNEMFLFSYGIIVFISNNFQKKKLSWALAGVAQGTECQQPKGHQFNS